MLSYSSGHSNNGTLLAALEFPRASLPECDPYIGWTNSSCIADDGTVNEVDVLIVTPRGFFLVEIKSDAGELVQEAGVSPGTPAGLSRRKNSNGRQSRFTSIPRPALCTDAPP